MGKRRQYIKTIRRKGVRFGSRVTRIRIPTTPTRPFILRKKDVLRKSLMQEDPHWFILHRRGIRRPRVGEDPLEARAISRNKVKGFLSERIVYQWLLDIRMVSGIDFDFQSSMEGGRAELGGMVVDFIFPLLKIALRIQGPSHDELLRFRKDEEQRQILEDMGYSVVDLGWNTIVKEPEFVHFMRNMFQWERGGGIIPARSMSEKDSSIDDWALVQLNREVREIREALVLTW